MSLTINNNKIIKENEIIEMFDIKNSTIKQWYRNGLKRFQINRINYIFEEDLEVYLKSILK